MIKLKCPNLECNHEGLADPYLANFQALMCMKCGTIYPNPYYALEIVPQSLATESDWDHDESGQVVIRGVTISHSLMERIMRDYLDGKCPRCFALIAANDLLCDACADEFCNSQVCRSSRS